MAAGEKSLLNEILNLLCLVPILIAYLLWTAPKKFRKREKNTPKSKDRS